jgi:anthranilate/para-aminobenzoate synthase component I
MTFETCRAAFALPERPGSALLFGGVGEVISGTSADWPRLRQVLGRWARQTPDRPHPPGGLAGAFAYNGSFCFHVCPEAVVVSTDTFWPTMEAVAVLGLPEAGWRAHQSLEDYTAMVRAAQEYIAAGDIYQVNLARRFSLAWTEAAVEAHGRAFFRHLWAATEAPCAAWVALPEGWLASASPELFLSIQGREVVTRPIKGTRPRDRDPQQDSRNAYELVTSSKELAELIMITDLERNDLGRVCEYGSVEVEGLAVRESFSHVHHLVSTVRGRLRPGVDALDALWACFPGGSITGAPKLRAMEVIRELEPFDREWFTGAIGWLGFDGSAMFNIAIRTVAADAAGLVFHAGCGITADSDPSQEFEETRAKAAAVEQAWGCFVRAAGRGVVRT